MPTYKNTTQNTIYVKEKYFAPGIPTPTELILDHIDGLERVDDAPFYNPINQKQDVIFTGAEDITIPITNIDRADIATIFHIEDCLIEIFLREIAESQRIVSLKPGDSVSIELDEKVDKLILRSDGAGKCSVIISDIGDSTGDGRSSVIFTEGTSNISPLEVNLDDDQVISIKNKLRIKAFDGTKYILFEGYEL